MTTRPSVSVSPRRAPALRFGLRLLIFGSIALFSAGASAQESEPDSDEPSVDAASQPESTAAPTPVVDQEAGAIPIPDTATELVLLLVTQGLGKRDVNVIEATVSEDFVGHGAAVAGRAELIDAVEQPEPAIRDLRVARVIADGELVLLHSEFTRMGKKMVSFDIYRVEESKIVEGWRVSQEQPETTVSGRSMIDGPTEPKDLSLTETNKRIVGEFVEFAFVQGKFLRVAKYMDGKNYLQHNPDAGDGLKGLIKYLSKNRRAGIKMNYDTLLRVIGRGDFVLAQGQGDINGVPTAFYDLFRVQNGKLIEHWDVIQALP